MSENQNALKTAQTAINTMYLIGDFEERFIPCLETVKNDSNMTTLVNNIWLATNKRFPEHQNYDHTIARYPALLTSIILVANHYEDLKTTDKEQLSALAHATYYLTNGATTDMVELFGDGSIIKSIDKKLDPHHNNTSYYQAYTLNAMGNILKQYSYVSQTHNKERIKKYLNNYIKSLTTDEVKNLEPMYQLKEEDMIDAYSLLLSLGNSTGEKGDIKHANRRL